MLLMLMLMLMLMLAIVIVIESYVRVQKTAVTDPSILIGRFGSRVGCKKSDDAGDTPAATEERSIVDRRLAE